MQTHTAQTDELSTSARSTPAAAGSTPARSTSAARSTPAAARSTPARSTSALNGQIHKITIGHFKGTEALEASVIMLVDGQEIRRRWKSPHKSERATEAWAREKAKVFLTGRSEALEPTVPTFATFATEHIEAHIAGARLAPSSAWYLRQALRDHLVPLFGDRQLDQIGDEQVTKLKTRADSEGKPLAASTINKLLQVFGQILRAAVRRRYIATPPDIKRIREAEERHDYYTPAEYAALVKAAATCPKTLALVLLAGDAGLRRGEIIALDWTRVDLAGRRVHVEVADWNGIIGPPKGKRPRSVPMTKRLHAALAALDREGERVLTRKPDPRGRRAYVPGEATDGGVLGRWLTEAEERADLRVRGLHTLRHTFCSHLAIAGVPVTAIRDLAGHRSIVVTNRYMHLAPAGAAGALDLLERLHAADAQDPNQETVRRQRSARRSSR